MTDLHTPTADDPGGSEDGPAPDDAIIVSHPGGDGGGQGVGTDQDPGGDGGSEQSPMPDPPRSEGDPGGDGMTEESPPEDPPPSGALHEITMG